MLLLDSSFSYSGFLRGPSESVFSLFINGGSVSGLLAARGDSAGLLGSLKSIGKMAHGLKTPDLQWVSFLCDQSVCSFFFLVLLFFFASWSAGRLCHYTERCLLMFSGSSEMKTPRASLRDVGLYSLDVEVGVRLK